MGKKHKTTVTHLEMLADPMHAKHPLPCPRGKCALMRAEQPPIHFYRYLYDAIGRDYVWVNRKRLTDEKLGAIIHDENVEIYILYMNGAPAGFVELDFRFMPRAELTFLGVMPDFIGTGLGRFLLQEALRIAWSHHPKRLILQTCTLDHPRALTMYQRAGFNVCGREEVELEEVD